ncbi:hypothetical protein HQ590_07205 [bacterium]|nr:hypothetical protein [bacterium]
MNFSSSVVVRGMLVAALVLCVVLAAVAVHAVGTIHQRTAVAEQATADLEAARSVTATATAKLTTEIAGLRRSLDAREQAYRDLQESARASGDPNLIAGLDAAPAGTPATAAAGDRPGGGPSWLERLRQEDPARYQQLQTDREQWRQRVAERFQEAVAKIDDRFQTAQTEEEADLLSALAETISQMDELREKWHAVRELPDDQRHEAAGELRAESMALYQKLTDLRAQDRQFQLTQLAGQIGYQGANQTAQFVDGVQQIINDTDTSVSRLFGFGRGRGGPGR